MMKNQPYLPGLDTIRLYAALAVVAEHTLGRWRSLFIIFPIGWNAVTLFFVLTGYIISYRLLMERQQSGKIDLKAFYLRRELRILPLYYLIVLVGGLLLPLLGAPQLSSGAALSIIFLVPQLTHTLGGAFGTINPVWSIGVEELFYFVFPFLIARFNFLRTIAVVIVTSVSISMVAQGSWQPICAAAARNALRVHGRWRARGVASRESVALALRALPPCCTDWHDDSDHFTS